MSYTICVDKLMRADAAHRCLKRRVHRHRIAARNAAEDKDAAQVAIEAIQAQMVQADQQRDVAIRCAEVSEEARTRTMVLASQQTIEFGHTKQEYMR